MTNTALGTWRNPPLAYVVAELGISPYYSMADKLPGLQDRLRSWLPKTIETQELVIEGNKPSTSTVWLLISADQAIGVRLGLRAISLHATSYVNSTDFLTRWSSILEAVNDAQLGAFIERAGLRYVDFIVPQGDGNPAAYLVPTLQGILPEGSQTTGCMWAAAFQFDGSVVNLRVGAPAPTGLLFPPDFTPLPLNKPGVMIRAEERLKEQKPIGFIDTDCIKEVNRVFDATELVNAYAEMQKLASRTFKSCLSSLAQKEWV